MLNETLTQLREVKTEKEKLSLHLKDLNRQEEYLENIAISQMREEGLTSCKIEGIGSATITVKQYPLIRDWDDLVEWMVQSKDFSLLKKGIKSATWQEKVEAGEEIPGIEPFEKTSLLFRRK